MTARYKYIRKNAVICYSNYRRLSLFLLTPVAVKMSCSNNVCDTKIKHIQKKNSI